MATVGVVNVYRGAEGVPVLRSAPLGTEVITSSGTSAQGSVTAVLDSYWHITVTGGAVWVAFGDNPTAVAGDGWLIPEGGSLDVEAVAGDKVAVVDV